MSVRLKRVIPVFHKSHRENLIWMVVGMVYSRSVTLPKVAEHAPVKTIQMESRVERFERLLRCVKLNPLDVLKPVARLVLTQLARGRGQLMILMDRTMINDTVNLLYVAVAFGSRALPLGWVVVPHEGNSNLALQQQLLTWLKDCLPAGADVFIVADREFHSIHLAHWIKTALKVHFVLRIKAGTWVQVQGQWQKAGTLAHKGQTRVYERVRVTRDRHVPPSVHLVAVWDADQEEPWLLISDVAEPDRVRSIYQQRFWIEEMFSDHKSRGLNLEATRLTDPDRLQRLLVAVTLAYLWIMEVGAVVVTRGWWRQVDNRGAQRSVSLCQIGLRWLREQLNQHLAPPFFSGHFHLLEGS